MADPTTVLVTVPLNGAVDEQTAKQYLDPAQKSVSVVNGLIYKEGSVDKRLGLALVPEQAETGISKALRLTPWTKGPQQLVALSGEPKKAVLYDWSAVTQGRKEVSELPPVAVRRTPVISNPSPEAPWILDIPVKDGRSSYTGVTLRLTLFRELPSYDLYATVVDRATNQVYLHKTLVFANRGEETYSEAPYAVALFCPKNALPGKDVCLVIQDNSQPDPDFINHVYLINYDYSANAFGDPVFLSVTTDQGGVGLSDAAPFMDHPDGNFIYMAGQTELGNEVHVYNFTSDGTVVTDRVLQLPPDQVYRLGFAIEGTWQDKCHFFLTGLDLNDFTYHQIVFQTAGDDLLTPDFGGDSWEFDNTSNVQAWVSGCCRIASGQTFAHVTAKFKPSPGSSITTHTGSWFNISNAQDYVGTGHCPFGFVPVAKPFVVDGLVYEANYFELIVQSGIGSAVDRSEQITLYLNRYTRLQELNTLDPKKINDYVLPVGCSAPRLVDDGGSRYGDGTNKKPFMSQTQPAGPYATQRFGVGLRTRGSGTPAKTDRIGPSWATDFYFDEPGTILADQYQPTELLGELGLTGGIQFVSDGLQATEDNYFFYPEFSYATQESPNLSGESGQFIYAVCYSYVDAAGLVHRSVPAFTNPVEFTSPGDDPPDGKAARLHIPVLSATWRDVLNPRQVYAEIYRTQADGSIFYFLDRVLASGLAWNDYEVEWPSSTTTDRTTDEALGTASLLYTTGGGELDNVNPPASFISIVHKDRRAIVDETGLNVWFTKEANSPTLAPGWNETLQVPFPEGGPITGLASMDGTFIVFKRSSIWKLYGSGPPNNGQSSDWTVPEAVVTDVGAVSWNSIVRTPMGYVFQAQTGFHLLTRSLTVEYVGQDVQDRIAAWPIVVSATLVTTNSTKHVRWTVKNLAGETSVIVWDYEHRTWSFYEYDHVGEIRDTAMSGTYPAGEPAYCVLNLEGRTWMESSRADVVGDPYFPNWKDQSTDGEWHYVTTSIELAPVRLGVQAGQRARVVQALIERLDPCGLRLELSFNDRDEVQQVGSWDSGVLDQLPLPQVSLNVAAPLTRCQSVQATLSDVESSVSFKGRGARFVNVVFELETLGQRWRQLPPLARR